MENPLHKRSAGIRFGDGLPVWPKTQNLSVGADSISARGRSRRRGVRRDGASRPTAARIDAAIPVCRALAVDRRGVIYPARGTLRRRRVPGTISGLRAGPCGPVGLRNAPAGAVRASSPTEVCNDAKVVLSRLAAAFSVGCRGGFHIRPRAFAPAQSPAGWGIPPYGRPDRRGLPI